MSGDHRDRDGIPLPTGPLEETPAPAPGPILVFLGEGGERATVPGAGSELAAIQAELEAHPAALVVLDPPNFRAPVGSS